MEGMGRQGENSMKKFGERNEEEAKGTAAAKAIAFKQLEFFGQTGRENASCRTRCLP